MRDRCPACDGRAKVVQATGPEPSDFLFIGEKPGREEAQRGWVFCGDTGTELDGTYLPLAGLGRKRVRVTNCLKCRLHNNNSKPTPDEVQSCARHWLPEEIERCQPKAIVLMGATACSLVPGIELDRDHGIPLLHEKRTLYFGNWRGWVWPMYHPAAGLHQTSLMIPLMEDFERIRLWARDQWGQPIAIPTDYALMDDHGLPELESVPLDTEEDFSVQYSAGPGHGRMILTSNEKEMGRLRQWLRGKKVLLHNALYDLSVLEQMGICGFEYRDTMQEAYHRGNLPQGLKAIGWRLFGVRMQSWSDLVMPYSRKQAIQWLCRAWDHVSDHRDRVEIQLKTKLKIEMRPTPLERDIKRILSHAHKPDYELWEKIAEAQVETPEIVDLFGLLPQPSIRHVPLEEAVIYGCQDADITGRFGAWLDRFEQVELPNEDWDQ